MSGGVHADYYFLAAGKGGDRGNVAQADIGAGKGRGGPAMSGGVHADYYFLGARTLRARPPLPTWSGRVPLARGSDSRDFPTFPTGMAESDVHPFALKRIHVPDVHPFRQNDVQSFCRKGCTVNGNSSESAETTQSQREPLRVSGFSSESAQTQPDRPARCGFEDSVPGAALIRDSESIKLNPESTETVQSQRKPTQSQRKPLRVSENHSELADSAGSAQSQPDRPARCEFDDSVAFPLTLSGLSVYLPDEVPAPSGSERAWISTSPAPVLRRDRIVVPVGGGADRNVVASGRGARTEMLIPAFAGRGQTLPDQTRPVSTSPAPVLRRRSTGAGEVPAWIRTRPDQNPTGSVLRRCRYFAGARMLFQSGGTRIECCNLRSGSADRNVVTCGRGTRTGMHAGE
eukprot:gene22627-biopygen14790